jgi:type IV pilus assembly protein PilB
MKLLNRQQLLAKLILRESLTAAQAKDIQESLAPHESIVRYLINNYQLKAAMLAQLISQEMQVALCHIQTLNRQQLPLNILEPILQTRFQVLPLKLDQQYLTVALSDPTLDNCITTLAKITHKYIKVSIIADDELQNFLLHLHTKSAALETGIVVEKNLAEISVVNFITEIIDTAIAKNASDIHFEPFEKTYRVRFRIDGVLHTMYEPEVMLCNRITTRLKVLARLDISEKRLPQDGRFNLTYTNDKITNFRVSSCPTLFGEKIVLRLLDTHQENIEISLLGLDATQQTQFLEALQRSQGMILVTGPTGSGKTYTLYTALHHLNTTSLNICTAEDPVEIYLTGVNQVNINPKAGLDFAVTLRAFLRQDPDIIMLGEIRDEETCDMAIKASQTGHLVLATVHTNNTIETIHRLQNLGAANFNIASALNLIIAQRLVRRLCLHCKKPCDLSTDLLTTEEKHFLGDSSIFEAAGCELCTAGFQGRLGIFEMLSVTPTLKKLLLEQKFIDLESVHRTQTFTSLRFAALQKVKVGLTSISEINRVIF